MPVLRPRGRPEAGEVLERLHALQDEKGWLPPEGLLALAREMGVPLGRLVATASFYGAFRLTPGGRHRLEVCTGTACHVKGGGRILEHLERALCIAPGETSVDGGVSLETVRCVGACSMAPVLRVDNRAFARVRPGGLGRLLAPYGILDRHGKTREARDEDRLCP